MLQETHSVSNDEKIWLSEWGGLGVFSHGRSNLKGVSILFPKGSDITIIKTIRDPDGRFLILQVRKGQDPITLVNIYAPTSNKASNQANLMGEINQLLANLEIQNLFIAGDFNIKLDDTDSASTPSRDLYINQIKTLISDYDLADVWKTKNPASGRGTFHRNTYSARLDYIFGPEYLIPSVSSIKILPEPLSDHCTVVMEVGIPSTPRGPGYWRFDNRLLTDNTFVEGMKDHIRLALQEEDLDNPNVQWEWVKFKIREFCLAYTIKRNRAQKALTSEMEKRLLILAEIHDLSDSQETASEVQSLKRQLAEIKQEKANKAIFKTKAKWIQLGERPSSYFLGLEKRQAREKTITSVKDENGRLLTINAEILAYEKRYFSQIYNEDLSQLQPVQELQLQKEDLPDSHRQSQTDHQSSIYPS